MLLLTFGAMALTDFEPLLRRPHVFVRSQHKRIIQRPRAMRCPPVFNLEFMKGAYLSIESRHLNQSRAGELGMHDC